MPGSVASVPLFEVGLCCDDLVSAYAQRILDTGYSEGCDRFALAFLGVVLLYAKRCT